MTAAIQPPWGTDWKPAPPEAKPVRGPGNPSWTPGCASPNPKGRPAGVPDKRLLATQAALDEMRNIVAMLVGRALEGDTNAASIVLSKVLPSVKAQAEKVNFEFDATLPISGQVAQVLDAVAAVRSRPMSAGSSSTASNRSRTCGPARSWKRGLPLLRRREMPQRKMELFALRLEKSAMRPASLRIDLYPDGGLHD